MMPEICRNGRTTSLVSGSTLMAIPGGMFACTHLQPSLRKVTFENLAAFSNTAKKLYIEARRAVRDDRWKIAAGVRRCG